MRRLLPVVIVLVSASALAQKPWELRVDLPVPVPVELPAVPPINPFAAPVVTAPAPIATPLRAKFPDTFSVLASVYIDAQGACRRVVFTRLPWPGLAGALRPIITATAFTPARASGAAVPVWLPLGIDLKGRIDKGRVTRVQGTAPDPAGPPAVEPVPGPESDARDAELPATSVERVEQLPNPKRFRVRIDGHTWRQLFRLLAEVGPDGRCRRVVFLTFPAGLRGWLLASMASWTFQPAAGTGGPVAAWVQLDGEIEIEMGDLASNALKVMRQGWAPGAAAPAAAVPPPGA
ncbi:MAG TPA: hypothetical protein PLB88_01485 [Thermoanaerobaculaceae bacterium]|nr:hypothetical protein [Thermoanaerobaculaceae bacterium]